jgi:hypothetical protein
MSSQLVQSTSILEPSWAVVYREKDTLFHAAGYVLFLVVWLNKPAFCLQTWVQEDCVQRQMRVTGSIQLRSISICSQVNPFMPCSSLTKDGCCSRILLSDQQQTSVDKSTRSVEMSRHDWTATGDSTRCFPVRWQAQGKCTWIHPGPGSLAMLDMPEPHLEASPCPSDRQTQISLTERSWMQRNYVAWITWIKIESTLHIYQLISTP